MRLQLASANDFFTSIDSFYTLLLQSNMIFKLIIATTTSKDEDVKNLSMSKL
jgi:hypothetical protein